MSKGQEEMRASAAHQVLDLIMEECRYWQGRDEARRGGYAILYAEAKGIIDREEQAARQQAPAEQEPVAWMLEGAVGGSALEFQQDDLIDSQRRYGGCMVPLYAAPQPEQSANLERIAALEQALQWIAEADWECEQEATDREVSHLKGELIYQMRYRARAALAKHGERRP